MISSVTSATPTPHAVESAAQAKPKPTPATNPQDTVKLSSDAEAHPSGDINHDGDSH